MLYPSVVAVKLPAYNVCGAGAAHDLSTSSSPHVEAVIQATFFAEDCVWFHIYENRSTTATATTAPPMPNALSSSTPITANIEDDRELFLRQAKEARAERRTELISAQEHVQHTEGEAAKKSSAATTGMMSLLGGVDGLGDDGVDSSTFKPLPSRAARRGLEGAATATELPSSSLYSPASRPFEARATLGGVGTENPFSPNPTVNSPPPLPTQPVVGSSISSSTALTTSEKPSPLSEEELRDAMLREMLQRQARRRERMLVRNGAAGGGGGGEEELGGVGEERCYANAGDNELSHNADAVERAFQRLKRMQGGCGDGCGDSSKAVCDGNVPHTKGEGRGEEQGPSGAYGGEGDCSLRSQAPHRSAARSIATAENAEFGTLAMSIPMRMSTSIVSGGGGGNAQQQKRPHICTTTLISDTHETHETVNAKRAAAQHRRMETVMMGSGSGGGGGGVDGAAGMAAVAMGMAMGMGLGGISGADGGNSSPQSLFAAGLSERLSKRFNTPTTATMAPIQAGVPSNDEIGQQKQEQQEQLPPYPFPFVFYVSCGISSAEAVPLLLGAGLPPVPMTTQISAPLSTLQMPMPFSAQIYKACCQLISKHHAFVCRRKKSAVVVVRNQQ